MASESWKIPFCLLVVDLRWRNSRKARAVGMVRLSSLVEMEFGALQLIGRPVLEAVNRRLMRNKYKQAQKQFFYHVCSYWCTLAFSISSLWSLLCMIRLKMGYVHLVRLWLENSKSHLSHIPYPSLIALPCSRVSIQCKCANSVFLLPLGGEGCLSV